MKSKNQWKRQEVTGRRHPALTVTTNMFNTNKSEQQQEAWEKYNEETEQKFKSYPSELYVLANKVYENETDPPNLRKLIEALFVAPDFRQAATFVENQTKL